MNLKSPKTPVKRTLNTWPRKSRRRGAATVEFAVCLPIIVLVVFGSIEGASMLFLRQAMIQSAYEGAKVAILDGSTNSDATAAIEAVGNGRRLNDLEIEFDPSNVAAADPGDLITVTVSAPGDSNSFLKFGPFKNKMVSASAVMVKE